ncbi:gamma-glutamyltransferase [Gemmatimonadota bacterium Y43]|uniref:gamma-glutamyltransferase n=1 Tax=Gaopeijia maritima TaxID=3119007 RepID=UPI0032808995
MTGRAGVAAGSWAAVVALVALAACSPAERSAAEGSGATDATSATSAAAPLPVAGRSTVYAPHGLVATSQPLATTAALRILEEGGNAFDAAVAASAVLSLVEPHMTGLGGDLFAIFWSAEEGRVVGLDASGRAGARMTPEQIAADGFDRVPYQGPGSVTVPGAIAGWAALLDRYGSRSLAEVVAPAIELAEDGFPVSPIIAGQWSDLVDLLSEDAGATATYLVDGGTRTPEAGEWFRNPDFAASLRMIAEQGPSAMYGGPLGQRIVAHLDTVGGYLTNDDMAAMEVRWVEPLSVDYRGWTVHELPPAGQGIAALQMLEMLESYDLAAMGHNSPAYLHHLIEAKKLAFADLDRYVSDPDHLEIDPMQLLAPAYVEERRGLIDAGVAREEVEPGAAAQQSETVFLVVADDEGNQIAFIHSIYEYFGSGVVAPGTGFVLQNRGAGFTLEEGHPNRVAPGKLPFHTLIPGFVTRDGEPYMAFGVMGGSMQPQGHVQLILNMLDFGMEPQAAVDAARFRHLGGLRVAIENVTPELRSALEGLGHQITDDWTRTAFGGAQVVVRLDGGGWAGASDARKDGMAAGH